MDAWRLGKRNAPGPQGFGILVKGGIAYYEDLWRAGLWRGPEGEFRMAHEQIKALSKTSGDPSRGVTWDFIRLHVLSAIPGKYHHLPYYWRSLEVFRTEEEAEAALDGAICASTINPEASEHGYTADRIKATLIATGHFYQKRVPGWVRVWFVTPLDISMPPHLARPGEAIGPFSTKETAEDVLQSRVENPERYVVAEVELPMDHDALKPMIEEGEDIISLAKEQGGL